MEFLKNKLNILEQNKTKKIVLIIGIIAILLLIAGGSYAYYQGTATASISGRTCFDIDYVKGNSISNANLLLYDETNILNKEDNTITIKNGMAVTNVSAGINSSCNIDGYLTINITSNTLSDAFISGDSVGALKYVIAEYDPNTYPTVNASTLNDEVFDIITSGSITIKNKQQLYEVQLPKETLYNYLIIFYIDGDLAMNDAGNTTYSASIEAVATQGKFTAVQYISNLYKNSNKTQVINNNINYNYATSVNLMNDRLGGTTPSLDGGNIRYFGAEPNNFVDIGDSKLLKNWQKWGYDSEQNCSEDRSWYQYMGFSSLNEACSNDIFTGTNYQFAAYDSPEACYEDNNCSAYWEDWGYDNEQSCESSQWYHDYGFSSVEELCSNDPFDKRLYQYWGYDSLNACYEDNCSINWEDWGYDNEASCNADKEIFFHDLGVSSLEEACNAKLKNYYAMGYDNQNSCLMDNDCSHDIKNYEQMGYWSSSDCNNEFNCSANWEDWGYNSEQDCIDDRMWYQYEGFSSIEEACSNDNYKQNDLWRIVGVFDGKLKLVRAESIGNYSWDNNGINEWSQADLMKLLNPKPDGTSYTGINGSLYWNLRIADSVKTKIAEVVWNTSGWNDSHVYADFLYEKERGTNVMINPSDGITRQATWTGKIGLLYPSDFGYGTDFRTCFSLLDNYRTEGCYSNDWLYNDGDAWLLTPYSGVEDRSWLVSYSGMNVGNEVWYDSPVYPVLNLDPNLIIKSGNGTPFDPYVIR